MAVVGRRDEEDIDVTGEGKKHDEWRISLGSW